MIDIAVKIRFKVKDTSDIKVHINFKFLLQNIVALRLSGAQLGSGADILTGYFIPLLKYLS